MVREKVWVVLLSAAMTALGAYLRAIVVPMAVLAAVMALDYGTGVAVAWEKKQLNSRIGLRGIVKKAAYLAIVAVGMALDYVVAAAGEQLGVRMPAEHIFGLLVCIWLIINECISILENADALGLPVPEFVEKLLRRLKERTEASREEEESHGG